MTADGWQGLQLPGWLAPVLAAQQQPVLPNAGVMPWAWHLCWAVLLAWLGWWLCARLSRRLGMLAAAALAVWALLPGPASAAFSLGLVFQRPSLTAVALCAWALWRGVRPAQVSADQGQPDARMAAIWSWLGVLLGWALLLDTLALLPFTVYPLGFGPAGLALALLALGLPWLVWGTRPHGLALCLLLALLLHVLLRLPSGNLWDALLDPLLWLWLQARWLWRLGRGLLVRASSPIATRA